MEDRMMMMKEANKRLMGRGKSRDLMHLGYGSLSASVS